MWLIYSIIYIVFVSVQVSIKSLVLCCKLRQLKNYELAAIQTVVMSKALDLLRVHIQVYLGVTEVTDCLNANAVLHN